MKTRRAFRAAWIVALTGSILILTAPRGSDAAFTVTFAQVGNDVVATGTGALNLTGVRDEGISSIYGSSIRPVVGSLTIGAVDFRRVYRPFFSSNAGFGADVYHETTFGTGYHVGILAGVGLYLSASYVSNTQFTSTATFLGTTIAGLGMTPGTYTYAYSATQGGPTLDTFTIQVGNAIPEPSSGLMCAIAGLAALAVRSIRRRCVR